MARFAVLNDKNVVINVIELTDDAVRQPPDACTLLPTDDADLGDTLVKGKIIKSLPQSAVATQREQLRAKIATGALTSAEVQLALKELL